MVARRNTNAQTEHSRRLRAETATARTKRLESEGWKKKTLLLPPESLETLEQHKTEYGGITGVVIEALRRLG